MEPEERKTYPAECPNCGAAMPPDSPTCASCGFTFVSRPPKRHFDLSRLLRLVSSVGITLIVALFWFTITPGAPFTFRAFLFMAGVMCILYTLSAIPRSERGHWEFDWDLFNDEHEIITLADWLILLLGIILVASAWSGSR